MELLPGEARLRPRRPVLERLRVNLLLAISPLHKARQHLKVDGGKELTETTVAPRPDLLRVVDFASREAYGWTLPTTLPEQQWISNAARNLTALSLPMSPRSKR